MRSVDIFDSTLRDGAQASGISFSVEDKLAVVKLLDSLGVKYIEAGNPGSNPKDADFFQRVHSMKLKNASMVAFGSTRRKNIRAEDDENLRALLSADTKVCAVFGKCWELHVTHVLETSPEENLRMIEDSCRFLCENGKEVIFDGEHFFDGYKHDPAYAMKALEAAVKGGASCVCLCDTNGGTFPEDVSNIVKEVMGAVSVPVAVHFHDDCGLAVANSICAVEAGACQVQGTFLGFGERCGNANLSAIIPNLQLKMGISCIPSSKLEKLTRAAKELSAIANLDLHNDLPYVGESAFSHKAGMHADGVLKIPESFEHIDPLLLGNSRRFPTSEMSGKAVIIENIRSIFPDIDQNSEAIQSVLSEIKALEHIGYQFEGADASLELLIRKRLNPFEPFFDLIYYHIYTDFANEQGSGGASATVKLKVNDAIQLMAAEGNGPVNALDTALRKALEIFYPTLANVKLTDYKVRVLDSKNATASGVRVLITSSNGIYSYTTVGVSNDVVAASWKALRDSMEYILLKSRDCIAF